MIRCGVARSDHGAYIIAEGNAAQIGPGCQVRRISGVANDLLVFLGERHDLAPKREAGRLCTHQLQLTLADLVVEAHDTHHPIASSLYYEDQRREAKRRAADFLKNRLPKYLAYFERVLARNPRGPTHVIGGRLSYADLSLFQVVAGLQYAFPNTWRGLRDDIGMSWWFTRAWRLVRESPRILPRNAACHSTSRASFAITRSSTGNLAGVSLASHPATEYSDGRSVGQMSGFAVVVRYTR